MLLLLALQKDTLNGYDTHARCEHQGPPKASQYENGLIPRQMFPAE